MVELFYKSYLYTTKVILIIGNYKGYQLIGIFNIISFGQMFKFIKNKNEEFLNFFETYKNKNEN